MKRKPSKRTSFNKQVKKMKHELNNGYKGIISLGDVHVCDAIYFQDTNSAITFSAGATITIDDGIFGDFGTKVRYGKNPKKVHPARRNKEKKKVREEAHISYGNETVTIYRDTATTWIVDGDNIT
jgi:hypothetical protein